MKESGKKVMYTVYCHVFPHGKMYVGLTKQKPQKRFKNGSTYKSSPAMYRAIQKYGWENIDHDIISEVETLEKAESLERYLIAFWDSTNSNNGYNILPGGGIQQNVQTEEIKRKRAESLRLRWQDPELRKKQGEISRQQWKSEEYRLKTIAARKGHMARYGKIPAEATKLKMSLAHKGRWLGDKSPCSKAILQYTKDGEIIKRWGSIREAERAGIALRSNIAKVAQGKVKSAGGFVWKYESDVQKVMDKTASYVEKTTI